MRYLWIFAMILSSTTFCQAQYLYEGFESGNLPSFSSPDSQSTSTAYVLNNGETWHAQNLSSPIGDAGVFQMTGNAPFAAHTGSIYAAMNHESTGNTGDINTFLISPQRTFNNGDTISFWTRTVAPVNGEYPDRLRLLLSTAGASTSPGSFSTSLLVVNPNLDEGGYPNAGWTQFSATLSGLSGPTPGRFAFNYEVTDGGLLGTNSNFIGIDTVEYTPIPEPLSILAVSCVGLAGWRLRRKLRG
jgi:hypothetical protein